MCVWGGGGGDPTKWENRGSKTFLKSLAMQKGCGGTTRLKLVNLGILVMLKGGGGDMTSQNNTEKGLIKQH